jgi:hypothetical protein
MLPIPAEETLPSYLYHYTSIQGVDGIIKSKAVWASELHFLNDSREWKFALELVRGEVLRANGARPEKRWPILLTRIADSLEQFSDMRVCVFCLSENPNQLSQWRGYCPPDGGYALQFKADLLRDQLHAQGFQLHCCDYEFQSQRSKVREVVSAALQTVGWIPEEGHLEGIIQICLGELMKRLVPLAPFLKHPDFHEEAEWRAAKLVNTDDPAMGYHIRGPVAVPHALVHLDAVPGAFPIEDITVGPGPHQQLASRGLAPIVFREGVRSITISQTPLREI